MTFPNKKELQKVWYLPQINQSPTSTAVAAEKCDVLKELSMKAKRKAFQ
jgi:hypothetical protein